MDNIPEDDILHSHHRENLKSYFWFLFSNTTTLNNLVTACYFIICIFASVQSLKVEEVLKSDEVTKRKEKA
jgi:hypothetical protein